MRDLLSPGWENTGLEIYSVYCDQLQKVYLLLLLFTMITVLLMLSSTGGGLLLGLSFFLHPVGHPLWLCSTVTYLYLRWDEQDQGFSQTAEATVPEQVAKHFDSRINSRAVTQLPDRCLHSIYSSFCSCRTWSAEVESWCLDWRPDWNNNLERRKWKVGS